MKPSTFILLGLASILPLRADNWVANGDFTNGISHWYGNGRAPADMTSDNPFDKPNPLFAKGLIVPLRKLDWTKVAQDFKGKGTTGTLTITYLVTPDLTFSTKKDDYVNMPHHIGYDYWLPFDTPPGQWIVFISDFGSAHGEYWEIPPKMGSSDVQTFSVQVSRLTPLQDKTVTLAFPPGDGNIVVLSVSMGDTSN